MADVERFIDTAADAGGDGTTRNHSSGDSTHAYASMNAWESAEQTDLVADTDTHRVRCAGSTADTTQVGISGWTVSTDFFITIQGDDAAPDSDGVYTGTTVWSTSHYRITNTGFNTLVVLAGSISTVIDGIQIGNTQANDFSDACDLAEIDIIVRNCRVTKLGGGGKGIRCATSSGAVSCLIHSNIVFECGQVGIALGGSGSGVRTHNAYNNTVFDCGLGIEIQTDHADLTYNIFNNALFDNTTDISILEVNATVNHDWNAGEDAPPTDETNGVTIGTVTDQMVDPQATNSEDSDVSIDNSGSTLYNASDITNDDDSNVPTVDIAGNSRNTGTGESTSIGAWANISEVSATAFPFKRRRIIHMLVR